MLGGLWFVGWFKLPLSCVLQFVWLVLMAVSSIRFVWTASGGSASASMESSVQVMLVRAVAAESVLVLFVLSEVVLLPITTTAWKGKVL